MRRIKRKQLIPSTHILMAFRNKGLPAADAIAELADNALGKAGATWFEFEFGHDGVTATDNGCGIKDIDSLFGLGYSQSRHVETDIGEFGVGSKDAQMHFGTHCRVQSVCDGRYCDHSIDWAKIERSGKWPKAFDSSSYAASRAPKVIRNGGTILTISNLVDRPRINMEGLIRRLAHRYRPALLKGKQIRVIDARRRVREVHELRPNLAWEGVRLGTTIEGEVERRKFILRYGALKEYDPVLNGVHFGFDNRFIEQVRDLSGTGMPSTLYAEVMLSPDWKGCFSVNKTAIVRHRAELHATVLTLLRDWISKLAAQAEQLRIEHVNFALKTEFNNIIVLDRNKAGNYDNAGDTKTSPDRGDGPVEPGPEPHDEAMIDAELAKQKSGERADGHSCKAKRSRPCGVSFQRDDSLGHVASNYMLKDERSLHILLNGTIPAIAVAYESSHKMSMLWPVIAREFAKFCQKEVKRLDQLIPGFIEMLNAAGYGVELEYPEALADKVFCYVMRQMPLTARERAVAHNFQRVEDAA